MTVPAKDRARNVYCALQRLTTVAIIHIILTKQDTGLKILTNIHSREISVARRLCYVTSCGTPQLSTFGQFPVLLTGQRHIAECMCAKEEIASTPLPTW